MIAACILCCGSQYLNVAFASHQKAILLCASLVHAKLGYWLKILLHKYYIFVAINSYLRCELQLLIISPISRRE